MAMRPSIWCRFLGHRYRFFAEGPVMHWSCQRACGAEGCKVYPSEAEARRFAASFDREDRQDLGRRAPVLGMFPLRFWYRLSRRPRTDRPERR